MYAIVSLGVTFICYTGILKLQNVMLDSIVCILHFSFPHVWIETKRTREEERRIRPKILDQIKVLS